jgi:hypothetical protein
VDLPEVFVYRHHAKDVFLPAPVGLGSSTRGETHFLDALQVAQGCQGIIAKPLGLIRAAIVEVNPDDINAAYQVQVFIKIIPNLPAHGDDGDKAGYAQGNGQDYPQVTPPMAHHLSDTDGQEVIEPQSF